MIGFLHPLFWIAGLAAAVPILIHLARRRQVRRIIFPAVRYLRRAEERHARRLRLRHLLLLALRMAMILLVTAAATGPLIGRGSAADHRPTSVAIVLDNSQSTTAVYRDRRVFDHFLDRVRTTVGLATPDDRVAVFAAVGAEPLVLATAGSDETELAALAPVPDVADLATTVHRANEWLRAADPTQAREIQILTDLQRVSLGKHDATQAVTDGGRGTAVVAYAPPPVDLSNGALADPVPEILPLNAHQETRLSVALRWFGVDTPTDPVVVRLFANGRTVAAGEATFGSAVDLSLPAQSPGWVQGYAETDRYGLSADDRRYFTWPVRPAPRVGVAGNGGEFLIRALDALAGGGRLERTDPQRADVQISIGGQGLAEGLSRGASVIVVPPESALELPRVNDRLARSRVPWRYDAAAEGGDTRLGGDGMLAGLGGLVVHRFYSLTPTGLAVEDTAILRLENGARWLVRGTTPSGATYVLLGSPLTPSASQLPVSAAMVPFVDGLVGDWARRGEYARTAFQGTGAIRLPRRARRLETGERSMSVEGGAPYRPKEAGNYRVTDGDSVLMAFSVNAPTEESDRARAPTDSLEAELPRAHWSWIRGDGADAWRAGIYRARRGRLSWRPLVALLVLSAILESTLAASGRRREGSKGAGPKDSSTIS